jgi:hypothetical protein
MLNKILIVFSFLVLSLSLRAQQDFRSSTHIGFNAGVNFNRVLFSPFVRQDLLTANSFGFVFRHVSEPHIGLQVEVNYSGRGWIENRDSIGTYQRSLQVLDIPVMAVFIAGSKTLRFAFTIGPYLSRRLQEKETMSIKDSENFRLYSLQKPGYIMHNPYYKPYYFKEIENKWEFGFTGGIGIEIYTKFGTPGIRASYSHGLTNIYPLNADKFYYEASRSQVIHAGITYFINF